MGILTSIWEYFTPPSELAVLEAKCDELEQTLELRRSLTNQLQDQLAASNRKNRELSEQVAKLTAERDTLLNDANKHSRQMDVLKATYDAQLEQKANRIAWLAAEHEVLQKQSNAVKQMAKDRLAGIEQSAQVVINAIRELNSELVV